MDLIPLIKIGFLDIGLIDLLDILIVGTLIFLLYRLLKGTLAVNIFFGVLLIMVVWFVVVALDMKLLKKIFEEFISVGVIALLIVFQPEVRRFLLYLGKGSRFSRSELFNRIGSRNWNAPVKGRKEIVEIKKALKQLSSQQTGALIVLAQTSKLQNFADSGVRINSEITGLLLESIFEKNSPLHDGAVIISDNRLLAAACRLPVSENPDLPGRVALRHRAAVGITEQSDAIALIVSEETGEISTARNGRLTKAIEPDQLESTLIRFFDSN